MVKIFEEIEDLNQLKREANISYGIAFFSFVSFGLLGYYLDKIWYIAAFVTFSIFYSSKRYFDTKYYITKKFIELGNMIKNGKTQHSSKNGIGKD